jgi:predicted CXXCH cytochrome family protein
MKKGLQRKTSYWLFVVGIFCTIMGLMLLADAPTIAQDDAAYVGVGECNDCHRDTAPNHKLSAHALSLIDPQENPELVLGDFAQTNPLLMIQRPDDAEPRAITIADIAYVVGSGRRLQQYLLEVEPKQYRILPFAWNVEIGMWEALTLADDNWNTECTSCHVTGYDAADNEWVDDGVQCESCHGAGENHVDTVDEADWEVDEAELVLIRESIIAEPSIENCESCHNANLNDGIHQPTISLMAGETLLAEVPGRTTAHATAPDAPDCVSCHMNGELVTEDGTLTAHDMRLSLSQQSATCTECHTELTVAYAQRFITGQQEDTAQRLAVIEASLNAETAPQWVTEATRLVKADSSGGVHNVAYTEALLNAVELQLGFVQQTTLFSVNPVSDPSECTECHAEEVAEWENSSHALASLNEHFQSAYSENGQPTFCLRCHASGFDALTQSIQYEGVVCSTCHVIQGEHPPAPATMGTNVTTCAACHSGGHASVYEEWLASEHSAAGVDCVDCHNAHTNEMLLGDVNTTCATCHEDAMQDEVHMGEDLVCTDCHMTPRETVDDPTLLTQTGHAMEIDPGVCADCHGDIHELTLAEEAVAEIDAAELNALHEEVEGWQKTAEENLTSGLLGGAIGVLLLLGLIYLVLRLGRSQ